MISPYSRTADVCRQLATDGATNKEIGERLNIASSTVRLHVSKGMELTGTRTRTALALWWRDNGVNK